MLALVLAALLGGVMLAAITRRRKQTRRLARRKRRHQGIARHRAWDLVMRRKPKRLTRAEGPPTTR